MKKVENKHLLNQIEILIDENPQTILEILSDTFMEFAGVIWFVVLTSLAAYLWSAV